MIRSGFEDWVNASLGSEPPAEPLERQGHRKPGRLFDFRLRED